ARGRRAGRRRHLPGGSRPARAGAGRPGGGGRGRAAPGRRRGRRGRGGGAPLRRRRPGAALGAPAGAPDHPGLGDARPPPSRRRGDARGGSGADGLLLRGATPETLLRRRGRTVVCDPMAGSAPRSPDPAEDRAAAQRLLCSAKDHREHRLVVEAMTEALAPFCDHLEVEPRPRLTATATVWHLATSMRGRLVEGAPSALGLAAALQPTPAVCGTPTPAALEAIHELEPVPRGLYSGLVGWVDATGD